MAELKLSIIGDVRDVLKKILNIGEALDDVVDDMKDVGKAGDKLETSLDDDFDKIARNIKKSGDKAGDGFKKGLKDGTDEAKKEAAQSGREAAASFSGGFEDVADFVQETLANALGGFGPLGAAAGIAIAATLGAALTAASAAQERLADARQAAGDLATTLYENKGELPIQNAIEKVLELLPTERSATNPFESLLNDFIDLGTNIDGIKRAASTAKVPVRDFIRGLSGADMGATKRALADVEKAIGLIHEKAAGELNFDNGVAIAQLTALKSQLEGVITTTELAGESTKLGTDAFGKYADAGSGAADDIAASFEGLATRISDFVDPESATVDFGAYAAAARAELDGLALYAANLKVVPTGFLDEFKKVAETDGIAVANQLAAALGSPDPAARQAAIDTFTAIGVDAGAAMDDAYVAEQKSRAQASAQKVSDAFGAASSALAATRGTADATAHSTAFAAQISRFTAPPIRVPTIVDDSSLRLYRPPPIKVPVTFTNAKTGQPI